MIPIGARGNLKIVAETAKPETEGTAAAEVPKIAPPKPAAVAASEELSEMWDEIVPQLDRAGLVAPSDGPVIEMCLRHFLAARIASDDFLAGTPTMWDAKNARYMKNPSEVIMRSESMAFFEYAKQLGMTFLSRARTKVSGVDGGDDDNPFA